MADDNVINLPVVTTIPLPAGRVLEQAVEKHNERSFSRVLIIGVYEDDPNEKYYGISDPDAGTAIYDMQRLERALHKAVDDLGG